MLDYLIGVNYWDSVNGTDMWRNYNHDVVEDDIKHLAQNGVKCMRVFPNWREFQPIMSLRTIRNEHKEYTDYLEQEITDPYFIDTKMIDKFKDFCSVADKYGIKLLVSIVTGWMSARMFTPRILEGKNLITDPEALYFTEKYVKGIVHYLKDVKNIVAWDLGNECNCMGDIKNRFEAANWVNLVHNAIICEDTTRPIGSGMHSLDSNNMNNWCLEDQKELDFMTTHPYPSPSTNADLEPLNKTRATIIPTAQSIFYSDISGKPCMIEESGALSQIFYNDEMSADFLRANILSSWANGITGYLWWCGMEHTKLKNAPYCWNGVERQLGLLNVDKEPKPVAREMKRLSEVITKIEQPKIKTDAVCILGHSNKYLYKLHTAEAAYAFAKQAGMNIRFNSEKIIDDSDIYILPNLEGSEYLKLQELEKLFKKVEDGATLYVSVGFEGWLATPISQFEKYFGLSANGYYKSKENHTASFPFGKLDYSTEINFKFKSVGAQVIAENEQGDVVCAKNKYGKGTIYFVAFSPEEIVTTLKDGFSPEESLPYYKIYKMFAKNNNIADCPDPYIGVTEGTQKDGTIIATFMNYSDKTRKLDIILKDGHNYEVLYGNDKELTKCEAAIIKIIKV